jgi:hypothetical protein
VTDLRAMLQEIRERHSQVSAFGPSYCASCEQLAPCDASLLADKLEIAVEALEEVPDRCGRGESWIAEVLSKLSEDK